MLLFSRRLGQSSDYVFGSQFTDEVPILHFTTLLWHCGLESRPAMPLTGCMGKHYQQRSPLISYANMARQYQGRKGSMVGCRAKSWRVLSDMFRINWMQT
jgi:hypothetical protein